MKIRFFYFILFWLLCVALASEERDFLKGFKGCPEDCHYVGEMMNDLPHGKGKMDCQTFSIEGDFKNGFPKESMKYIEKKYEKEGYGICAMEGFLKHGECIFYSYHGGARLRRFYVAGEIDEKRVSATYLQDVLIYEGQLDKQGQRDGYGHSFRRSGQEFYKGEWKNSKMHGFGIQYQSMHYGRAGTLIGEWENGLPNGFVKGVSEGGTYIGEYDDDGMNGYGRFQNPEGEVLFGFFRDSALDGPGVIDDEISIIMGHFQKGSINPHYPQIVLDKYLNRTTFLHQSLPDKNGKRTLDTGLDFLKKEDEVYVGEMLNGIPHGYGIVKNFRDQVRIMGIFDKGKLIEVIRKEELSLIEE